MKTYARVENHVVAEVINTTGDIVQMFHPSLVWVEVTGKGVQEGWMQNSDGTFAPPPAAAAPAAAAPPPPSVAELLTELTTLRSQVAQLHGS
jgi:hypothetical protein